MKRIIFFITIWIGICFSGIGQISKSVSTKQSDLKTVKVGEYDKMLLDNVFYMTDIVGQPELPVYIQSFVVPVDAQITGIKVNNLSKQKLAGTYYIHPAQPPLPVSFDGVSDFILPDPAVYNSSLPYPGKQAEIISDDVYLGYRIITVRLYPVEYNPKTKELYICNFDFGIDYSINKKQAGNNEFVTQTQSLYRYELNKKNVKFFVENPEIVDDYDTKVQKVVQGKTVVLDFSTDSNEKAGLRSQVVSVIDEQVPDYIIITNNALKQSFQTLADWKTKKGIFTVIVTTEEINANYSGSDLQEKIRNYLINANNRWGTGLYVLLGGDINIVPSRFIRAAKTSDKSSYPSDKYYSTSTSWGVYQGNVFNWDNSISIINLLGRIPVSNAQEVTTYTNKVIAYEKANGLGDLNYLKNNLYADAYLEVNAAGTVLRNFFHKKIKDDVVSYVPAIINRKFICDNADCTGDINRYTPSGTNWSSDCSNGNVNGDIELNRDNFLSSLNTGANLSIGKFHFVYHLDHSGATGMGTSGKDKGQSINISHMDNLTNGTSYQILMSGGCMPANFAYDCIAKHYLINPNGGGVAFIGNTDVGWQGEEYQVGIFSNAIYSTPGHPSLGRYDIGSAYRNVCVNTTWDRWRLHLLGDPQMQIWTNTPQPTFTVSVPSSIQASVSSLSVTVSGLTLPAGETALICVQKGTEVYETQMISGNGTYMIPLTVETAGIINVTVAAHNYVPVEKTVQVTASTTANPIIQSVNFVDNNTNGSNGNSNGRNDAGETIRLEVVFKNNGATTANNLTATLSSTSGYINISGSTVTLGSIASNGTAIGQFLYTIDKDAPEILANNGNPVQFKLDIRDASTLWTRTFNIDVFATELEQRNKIIVSTNGSLVTFNIELQNMGQASATGLTATLKIGSGISGIRSYPVIERFETKTAVSAFQFTIPSGYTSTNTPLILEVTNAYGKMWSFNFDLAKPNTITGLDFTATTTEIDLTWTAPSGGASGYNIYRCAVDNNDMESGSYARLNTAPVSFPFFNDRELDILTKYYYKITAVSSSGMESDPIRILAWTSYGTKYYFPVYPDTSIGTISSPINIADVNMDGKKEIFVGTWRRPNTGFLMGFDYQGNELFDIDNNVTTVSGFAELSGVSWAIPALADIKQNGKTRVIIPTRSGSSPSNNNLYCFSVEDNNGDHKPDLIWSNSISSCVRGAVVANIDNSPDGSMEVIIAPEGGSSIFIYSADGQLLRSINSGVNGKYEAIAVADLDGDGDLEIIRACGNGVYVWHHDGTNFIPNKQPIYSNPTYSFNSSVTICDLQGNGQKVILTSAFSNGRGHIFGIKPDGSLLSGWSPSTESIAYIPTSSSFSQEIAVGNLFNDGNLKVVAMGNGEVKIWNHTGTLHRTISVPNLSPDMMSPLLADVDGDDEAEIIFGSINSKNVYAYKASTGAKALGFPLSIGGSGKTEFTPAIADVDGDGKNELLIPCGTEIGMFATSGRPDRIEWGTERHNPRNTGEYSKPCISIIRSNTTWSTSRNICGDLIVESGTLTINSGCSVTMDNTSSVVVMAGATLKIDNARLQNTNVNVMPQGNLIQDNNGCVNIRSNALFNIHKEATWSLFSGAVE